MDMNSISPDTMVSLPETKDLSLDLQIRTIAEFGKFYSQQGFLTPSDQIDVEILLKDGLQHLLVIQYPDDNNIRMLYKTNGKTITEAALKTFQHFTELAQRTPISAFPTEPELAAWNAMRTQIIAEREASGDIKPVKISGTIIEDGDRDIIGELL